MPKLLVDDSEAIVLSEVFVNVLGPLRGLMRVQIDMPNDFDLVVLRLKREVCWPVERLQLKDLYLIFIKVLVIN